MNSTPPLPPAEEQKDNNGNVLDGLGAGDLNDGATATELLTDAAKEVLEHLGNIVEGVSSLLP